MKSLVIFRKSYISSDSYKLVIRPSDCRDSAYIAKVRDMWIAKSFCFKDIALSLPITEAEFDSWVDKCLKSFAKRSKSRVVKYAPCEIIIKSLLSKCKVFSDFEKWAKENQVADCFNYKFGLRRGYAAVNDRFRLYPLQTQTGYGLFYKTYSGTSYYWYNRIIIDLGKIDRLLQVLS